MDEEICPSCKKPQEDRPMICCDSCNKWCHNDCVGQYTNRKNLKWYGPCCSVRWTGEWVKPERKKRKTASSVVRSPCKSLVKKSPWKVTPIKESERPGHELTAHAGVNAVEPNGLQGMAGDLLTDKSKSGVKSIQNCTPPAKSPIINSTQEVSAIVAATKKPIDVARALHFDDNSQVKPERKNRKTAPSVVRSPCKSLVKESPWKVTPIKESERPGHELTAHAGVNAAEPNGLQGMAGDLLTDKSKTGIKSIQNCTPPAKSPIINSTQEVSAIVAATKKPIDVARALHFDDNSQSFGKPSKNKKSLSLVKLTQVECINNSIAAPFKKQLKNQENSSSQIPPVRTTPIKSRWQVSAIEEVESKLNSNATSYNKRQLEKQEKEDMDSSIDSDLSDDFQPKVKRRKFSELPAKPQEKNAPREVFNNDSNAEWDVAGIDEQTSQYLQSFLPVEYQHTITAVQPYKLGDQSLTAIIRLPIDNSEEALEWLTHYQSSSFSDFRVSKTFPKMAGQRVVFKKQFRCHHNTHPNMNKSKSHHKKHVNCTAKLMITIKNKDMQKSTDSLLKSHPMEVRLRHWHNHPIQATDVLRFRRPSKATKEIFMEYFKKGHTPSSALKCHKFDLQSQDGDDFFLSHADGSVCPDLHWCYYQYYKIFKAVYGPNYGEGMVEKLQEVVKEYNLQCKSKCAEVFIDNEDIVVAVCTPLMKRVHELLKSSSEVVIMDFSGNMDRYDTRIGFLIAPSLAGGLPLGIIMTSSENESLVTKGLQMLQDLYPEKAFYGQGQMGPKVFITDAAKNERNSLAFLYPLAILLLCYFHTLQAFLRYITAAEHHVKKDDKAVIYDKFKDLVKSKTEEDFEKQYKDLISSELLKRNKIVADHLLAAYPNRKQWALCYRSDLVIRGNNTSNLAEGNFLQLKSTVLERLKAFNMVQLFDFLVTKLDAYYKSRIASVLNNRVHVHQKSRYHAPKADKLSSLSCTNRITENIFEVKNSKTSKTYVVDMEAEICSCPMGFTGAPCKHQFYVATTFGISSAQFHDTCGIQDKLVYHKIMVGNTKMPQDWYKSLHDGPQNTAGGSDNVDEGEAETSQKSFPDNSTGTSQIQAEDNETADNPSDIDASQLVKEWRTKLTEMFDDLDKRLSTKPELFLPGVRAWVTSYFKVVKQKSDNGIASALFAMKNGLRTGHWIGVQPTAPPRRIKRTKPHLGARACKQTGKPPKAARVVEHGYNRGLKRKGHMAPLPPAKKRHTAAHSLTQRVDTLRK